MRRTHVAHFFQLLLLFNVAILPGLRCLAQQENSIPANVYQYRINGNDDKYGVHNGFISPLTAYVVIGGKRDGTFWTHAEDFRITQADLMPPGQNRDDPTLWYAGSIPIGLKVIAAIFADGTARGDSAWIDSVMEKRKEEIWVYETMSHTICSMARQGQGEDSIVAALTAKKNEYLRNKGKSPYVNKGGEQAYVTVIKSLNGGFNRAGTALASTQTLSAKLRADPVKDSSGRLYLSDAVPSTACRLP